MELPAGWSTRRPTLDDIPAILALVHASDIAAGVDPDFSAEDVREALVAPNVDPSRDSWLAVDQDGELVGWAYLENAARGRREMAEVYAHPERGLPAQSPLLARLLGRVAQRAAEFGFESMTVRGGAIPGEKQWIATLRDAGFAFVKRYARMRRSLAGLSADPPPPPPGVTIRPIRPDEADLRLFHRILDAAFRDTPDYQPTSYEQWYEQAAASPDVAFDEWFLATVHDVPAGILQSADKALDQNEGWVRNLAVLREHRHLGVGGALLGRAFARYVEKGREYAGLGVDLSNPTEAARLYRSAGMSPLYEADIFERNVVAAG